MRRPATRQRSWALLFARNVLLCLLPVTALWAALTPAYNRFLLGSSENLLHFAERPDVTDLLRHGDHHGYVARRDFPPARRLVHQLRVTDIHFHLILVAALFLSVPGVPWRERLGNLGVALLATVAFDVVLLAVQAKAFYAARLGDWSLEHYGPFARNAWGLAGHLLDLPFKLGLPFLLWAGFYLRHLMPSPPGPLSRLPPPPPGEGEGKAGRSQAGRRR